MSTVKLFLFDLDGTLVSTGGAGLRALGRAFKEMFGVDNAHERVDPRGKTDPAIFREIFQVVYQRPMADHELSGIGSCYLRHLEVEMRSAHTKTLPGVWEFLNGLSSRADVLVGLGTGNLEKGARLKLNPTSLNPFFSFGGFGSDAEDRAEVLRHGHRRAEERVRLPIRTEMVFVIGDTRLDIQAAKRAGFKSVAVASGSVPWEDLRSAEPDFLMRDMTEGQRFLNELAVLETSVS